jgi:hypothetical protein
MQTYFIGTMDRTVHLIVLCIRALRKKNETCNIEIRVPKIDKKQFLFLQCTARQLRLSSHYTCTKNSPKSTNHKRQGKLKKIQA